MNIDIDCSDEYSLELDCVEPVATVAADSVSGIAFDRSMRFKDRNGFMHVKDCRISKANICPYLGREIPGYEKLGLNPDQVYKLYRDASALQAAASTFERMPLMVVHTEVTAENIRKKKMVLVGCLSNVRWEAPYLVADLTVWDKSGIDLIESEVQRELSPGYHYRPEMTSGTLDGERYDGRMLDIGANHLCVVEQGRTGPDVLVNDAAT